MKPPSNVEISDATPAAVGAIIAQTILNDALCAPSIVSTVESDSPARAVQRLLLAQLELRGLRYALFDSKEQDGADSLIGIEPEDMGRLRSICQSLAQIKLVRFVESSGECHIIFDWSDMGLPRYIATRIIPVKLNGVVGFKGVEGNTFLANRGSSSSTASPRGSYRNLSQDMKAWIRPGGLFCVFMGPDGVGKSTTIQKLRSELEALSIPCTAGRWRPGVIRKVAPDSSNRMPHAKTLRGRFTSSLCLLGLALDFTIGYVMSTRPAMMRAETVIFDRYFHDLLIDPKRYRYAGPMWLPRLIGRLVPPRKALFIILDADEEVILSRKQELPPAELRRQRIAYRTFASNTRNSVIISAQKPVNEMVAEIMDKVIDILASRNGSHPKGREITERVSASQATASSTPNR